MIIETQSFNSSSSTTHGYVEGPSTRGTLDILWSSLITMFLCIYVSTHTHVVRSPANETRIESLFLLKRSKLYTSLKSIFLTERPICDAFHRLMRARRATKTIRLKEGFEGWTITHSFFADMGGFIIKDKDGTGAEEMLTTKKIIEYGPWSNKLARITQEELLDRSKADAIVKTVTLFQVLWFLTQSIARAVQRLPRTSLKIYILFQMAVSVPLHLFYWRCPQDIVFPIYVDAEGFKFQQYSPKEVTQPRVSNSNTKTESLGFDLEIGVREPIAPDHRLRLSTEHDSPAPTSPLTLDPTSTSNVTPSSMRPHRSNTIVSTFRRRFYWSLDMVISIIVGLLYIIPLIPAARAPPPNSSRRVNRFNLSRLNRFLNCEFPTKTEKDLWLIICSIQYMVIVLKSVALGLRNFYRLNEMESELSLIDDSDKHPRAKRFFRAMYLLLRLTSGYLLIEGFIGLRSLSEGVFITVQWENWVPFI